MKAPPRHAQTGEDAPRELWEMSDQIELVEVHAIPADHRIIVERGLHFFTSFVERRVNLLQRATRGVADDSGPSLVSLPEGDRIGVAGGAIAAPGLVGRLPPTWTAPHHRGPCGPPRRRPALRLR